MNNHKPDDRTHQHRLLSCAALCVLLSPIALSRAESPVGENETSSTKSGIFVPLFPEPVHQLDLTDFTDYQVNFLFDLRDTPENRQSLKEMFTQLDERGPIGGVGRVSVTLFGENGSFMQIHAAPETRLAELPVFPYSDPMTGKTYLTLPMFFINSGNFGNHYKDIGRAVAISFRIFEDIYRVPEKSDADKVAEFIADNSPLEATPRGVELVPMPDIVFPLHGLQVIKSMLRPDRNALAKKLNLPSVYDPEVVAWDNRWLSMHPTLEQWAARVPDNPDPAAPETRQRWQVAISRISQKSSFTLREGYQEYESDGNIQGSLYEDGFRLGKQLFIVTDEEFAKLEGGSFQPLMETLWNRYGSKNRGEWEEIGTQYSFDEGRTGQVLKENTNLTTVVFDEEVFSSRTQGRSTTDTESTTDTVSGNAGFEYSGFKIGGSTSRAQTNSRSMTLSNSTTESKKKKLRMEKQVPPGNLNQIAMGYTGLVEEIREGQFVIRRYREIKQVTLLPVWTTLNNGPRPERKIGGYESVTQIGSDRATSSFGKELDPESLAVLKMAGLKDLGNNNFPLFGKWQQVDVDDGEITFVTVGTDGSVYDGRVNKPGGRKFATLSQYEEEGGPIATLMYQELGESEAEHFRLILDRPARDIKKIVFLENGNQPLFIWYAL